MYSYMYPKDHRPSSAQALTGVSDWIVLNYLAYLNHHLRNSYHITLLVFFPSDSFLIMLTHKALWKPTQDSEDWFGLLNSLEDKPLTQPILDRHILPHHTSSSTASLASFLTTLDQNLSQKTHDHRTQLSLCNTALNSLYAVQSFPSGSEVGFETWSVYMHFILVDHFSNNSSEGLARSLLKSNLKVTAGHK